MNPIASIKANMNMFTKKEKLIAEAVLVDPLQSIQMNLEEFALQQHSSKSAYIRMCQKLGYNGYTDFRFSLSNYMISTGSKEDVDNPMQAILNCYRDYILQIAQTIHQEDVTTLAKWIQSANRIKIFGLNRTGLSAKQLRMRLVKLGYDSEAIVDTVVMRDVSTLLKEDDLCIIFSIKAMPDYQPFIRQMKDNKTRIVLCTMTPKTPLAKDVDKLLCFPYISRSSAESFMDDQPIFFVFIEILLNALAHLNNA